MRMVRGMSVLTGTALVLTLVLSGCSATIAPDPNAAPAAGANTDGADDGANADATDTNSTDTDTEPADEVESSPTSASGTGSVTAEEHRAALVAAVDQQLTCGGGDLEITDFAVRVEVTDDCDTIVVTGSSVMVIAQQVKTLVVDGFATEALVSSVDAIRVTTNGSSTTVRWEDGAPTIDDAGFASDLRLSEFVK